MHYNTMEMMRIILFFLSLIALIASDSMLVDQCYYDEIPNFTLEEVKEPAYTLHEYIGDPNITDRYKCYLKCCDDEYQIGSLGRCTAATYYMNTNNQLVCKLLHCKPENKCLWSSGSPGKFGVTIRSTKTTTLPPTTTPIPTTTAQPIITSEEANLEPVNTVQNNPVDTYWNGTAYVPVTQEASDSVSNENSHSSEGMKSESSQETVVEHPDDTALVTHGTIPQGNSNNKYEGWSWDQHPDKNKKPSEVRIQPPPKRGHQVPMKGLVAGIVVAILLLLVLIGFLTKQMRRTLKHPVHYKPIHEEEYQKLTVGDD